MTPEEVSDIDQHFAQSMDLFAAYCEWAAAALKDDSPEGAYRAVVSSAVAVGHRPRSAGIIAAAAIVWVRRE